jgi:FAD synthase
VRKYANAHGIEIEYIEKELFQNEPISSSRIRQALATGDFNLAQQLLGKKI